MHDIMTLWAPVGAKNSKHFCHPFINLLCVDVEKSPIVDTYSPILQKVSEKDESKHTVNIQNIRLLLHFNTFIIWMNWELFIFTNNKFRGAYN